MSYRAHRPLLSMGIAVILLMNASPIWADSDVRAEIEAANKVLEAVASRSDGAGMAALYTADAQVLAPQSEVVAGAEAIGKFWQAAFDSGIKGVTLTTLEVEEHGDTANEVGSLEILGADEKVLDRAKYVVIWKKEGSSWKLHRDIWNTSVAPPSE